MARVTVEDCLKNVSNRFELVLVASKRARQLAKEGKDPLVPSEGDKMTVIALREIAGGLIDKSIFEEQKKPSKMVTEDLSMISQEIIAETQKTEIDVEAESTLSVTSDTPSTESDNSDSVG